MSYGWACWNAKYPNDAAVTAQPTITACFEPKRLAIQPAEKPTTTIPSVEGSR